MTAALAEGAAGSSAASSGAGNAGSVSSAPGNPLNAPGSARRRKAARGRRNLNDLATQQEREEELQARRINAKHAAREQADAAATAADPEEQAAAAAAEQPAPAPASPGAGTAAPAIVVPAAVQTGSGFLLGLFAWGVGLAYLKHGPAGVKQFLSNKFLNHG